MKYNLEMIMRKLIFILMLMVTGSSFSQVKNSLDISKKSDTLKSIIKEQKAHYPGGQKAMISFIRENLIISKKMKRSKIKGTVIIGFTIDKTGKVVDIKILQSLRKDLDNLAIGIVKKMPLWEPAIIRGFKVKAGGQRLPFRFNLPMK